MQVHIDEDGSTVRAVGKSLIRLAGAIEADEIDDLMYPWRAVASYMQTLEDWAEEYRVSLGRLVG